MLGDIFISTQLLITHLVTTFSLSVIIMTFLEYTLREVPSNKMSMVSHSVALTMILLSVGSNRARKHICFLS